MQKTALALALFALVLAGCSTSAPSSTARATPTAALTQTPTPSPTPIGPLGAAGCHPPSPIDNSPVGPEAQGTSSHSSLWALLMPTSGIPVKAGTAIKIVWRMTGSGDFHLVAIGPQGQRLPPSQGPEAHGGSNWNRPGDEWGSVFDSLPLAGCWDFRATRDDASGDVWLVVTN
jgi:hypothetical protein